MSAPPGHIPAAEYGRLNDIGKSGMSRLIARGLPVVDGQDSHGRLCKFVDPHKADVWRATNCTPKIFASQGKIRGAPSITTPPKAPPLPPEPPDPSGGGDGGGGNPPDPRYPPPKSTVSIPASDDAGDALSAAVRIQTARAQREEDITATTRLKRLLAEGALLDRSAAIDAHESFVGQVAVLLDRMPADHATRLASKLGSTEHEAYLALKDVADRLRNDLAAYAERERDRLLPEVRIPEPRDV